MDTFNNRIYFIPFETVVIKSSYFVVFARYANTLWFWLLAFIHVMVISVINGCYGKFNEINKMTTDRIEQIVLSIVYVISTLFTNFEMKPPSQRVSRRKIIVSLVSFVSIFIQIIWYK